MNIFSKNIGAVHYSNKCGVFHTPSLFFKQAYFKGFFFLAEKGFFFLAEGVMLFHILNTSYTHILIYTPLMM
jgi:hypothetical protein